MCEFINLDTYESSLTFASLMALVCALCALLMDASFPFGIRGAEEGDRSLQIARWDLCVWKNETITESFIFASECKQKNQAMYDEIEILYKTDPSCRYTLNINLFRVLEVIRLKSKQQCRGRVGLPKVAGTNPVGPL